MKEWIESADTYPELFFHFSSVTVTFNSLLIHFFKILNFSQENRFANPVRTGRRLMSESKNSKYRNIFIRLFLS